MSKEIKYFATFGSGQLSDFNVNPMDIALFIPGASENELRQRLQEKPFMNKYCTTYPFKEFKEINEKYGMLLISVHDLIKNSYRL